MKVFAGINDLATLRPDLAREWHPTKNGSFRPEQASLASSKKVWWLGKCGHEWEGSIKRRSVYCPVCPAKMIAPGTNSLAKVNSLLASQWHPTKNGTLLATQVGANSRKCVWWLGECGHEWEAIIRNRVRSEGGCIICPKKSRLKSEMSLAVTHPDIAAEWHPAKNGDFTPEQITAGSGIKVWWLGECGHEWWTAPYTRTNTNRQSRNCAVCAGQRVLRGFNDLATTQPILAAEWHPTKNGDFTPEQITAGSPRKVWWLGKCGHEWEATVGSRKAQRVGCAFCSRNRVLSGFNDLATTHPEIAAEWHPTKNSIKTSQVTSGSQKKYWWICSLGHEWETSVQSRVGKTSGCLVCSNKRVLIGSNDLATTHPILASEWHPTKNEKLTPQQVHGGSHKKVWWLGICSHEWQSQVKARTIGKGCGQCANHVSKAERQIREFLEGLGLTVEISNRIILGGKEIDLWVSEKNVGIEFNGLYWHSEKYRGKDFHYDKWIESKRAGINLIQIWEDDWTLRSDIIKRMFSAKLDSRNIEQTRPTALKPIRITVSQAKNFFVENHLKGYALGTYHLGLVDSSGILQASLVLNKDHENTDKALSIVRYYSRENYDANFVELLTYAINKYQSESFTVLSDNCEGNDQMYKKFGFIEEEIIFPDYMYVIRQQRKLEERKPKSDYPKEKFRDNPALNWEEGLTELELADLNKLARIWDAGETIYRLSLENKPKGM